MNDQAPPTADRADRAVTIRSLVKRYGELIAVDGLSLEIGRGEVLGLLGPNGSGKTTTINCLLQLLTYDKGEIRVFGRPMGHAAGWPGTAALRAGSVARAAAGQARR